MWFVAANGLDASDRPSERDKKSSLAEPKETFDRRQNRTIDGHDRPMLEPDAGSLARLPRVEGVTALRVIDPESTRTVVALWTPSPAARRTWDQPR
jgi:hypothetical protein